MLFEANGWELESMMSRGPDPRIQAELLPLQGGKPVGPTEVTVQFSETARSQSHSSFPQRQGG